MGLLMDYSSSDSAVYVGPIELNLGAADSAVSNA